MNTQAAIGPVRKTLDVGCSVERAFRLFTEEIGRWWPTQSHSVGASEVAQVVFEQHSGGRVYEVNRNGDEADWGRVVAWDPPHRFVMTWHPGGSPAQATELEVRFAPEGDGTRVQLEHRGWEVCGAKAATLREDYDTGWTTVLGYYTRGSSGEG
jgi:uncharacterized protein YndB with AHSA1/START domain